MVHKHGRARHTTKVHLQSHVNIARKKPKNSIKGQETKHVKYYIRGQEIYAVPKKNARLVHG